MRSDFASSSIAKDLSKLLFSAVSTLRGFTFPMIYNLVIPKPYTDWDQSSRDAIFPLMLIFSIGWSFEMCVHSGNL
jgi:hypothetical protein